jgi:hypothetical protein
MVQSCEVSAIWLEDDLTRTRDAGELCPNQARQPGVGGTHHE